MHFLRALEERGVAPCLCGAVQRHRLDPALLDPTRQSCSRLMKAMAAGADATRRAVIEVLREFGFARGGGERSRRCCCRGEGCWRVWCRAGPSERLRAAEVSGPGGWTGSGSGVAQGLCWGVEALTGRMSFGAGCRIARCGLSLRAGRGVLQARQSGQDRRIDLQTMGRRRCGALRRTVGGVGFGGIGDLPGPGDMTRLAGELGCPLGEGMKLF